MTSKRTYLTCYKCGNNTMGRYKDEQDNPLCYSCRPKGKLNRLSTCKDCGTGHYCTSSINQCFKCYKRDHLKELRDCNICPICNKTIRSRKPFMDRCITCMGQKVYSKLSHEYSKHQKALNI